MSEFHQHPDNLIFVRTDEGIYLDSLYNFLLDYGGEFPVLPPGNERYYIPGKAHFINGNPAPLEWAHGDAVILAYADLIDAQNQRNTPPPPSLAELKLSAFTTLNNWRGRKRLEIGLTEAKFQDLVYSGKTTLALNWLSNPELPFPFPLEAEARGMTNDQFAQYIIETTNNWTAASDQIEAMYIQAHVVITIANSPEDIQAIIDSLP